MPFFLIVTLYTETLPIVGTVFHETDNQHSHLFDNSVKPTENDITDTSTVINESAAPHKQNIASTSNGGAEVGVSKQGLQRTLSIEEDLPPGTSLRGT